MGLDLTAANANITLTLLPLFTAPQQLQQFAADDVFDTPDVEPTETVMGVDGVLSGGMVYKPVEQRFHLQANSPSIAFFDTWYLMQQSGQQAYVVNGVTILPAIKKMWVMTNGFLIGYKPLPQAKKLLMPQDFGIRWNLSAPVPTT